MPGTVTGRSGSGTMHLRWSGCGGFEARFPSVNVAFDPYFFGEALTAAEPVYDYLFITHEHFDHCHPPTLQRLCRGDRFRRLYVSPGCVDPAQPVAQIYGDAAFERDLPITKSVAPDHVQVLHPWITSSLVGAGREFPSRRPRDLEGIAVEVVESGESASPELPTCGYLVTDLETSVSVYHTGDLHEPYPELASLAGKVDYLIHMKTGMTEWEGDEQTDRLHQLVDWVRPRFLIPTHYRTDRRSDPIPHGTWPPDVTDANAFVEWIRAQVGGKTTVLPFTAGVWYEVGLPSLDVIWKWNWRRTWDVPPWRA